MLDPIQNHALRLCLGAYRTSPSPVCTCKRTTSLHPEEKVVYSGLLNSTMTDSKFSTLIITLSLILTLRSGRGSWNQSPLSGRDPER